LISPELSKRLCLLSHEIRRQIGLLIDRKGWVEFVIVGDHKAILIPDLEKYRSGGGRLKGLRCVHTHLDNEPLSRDDLLDLSLLKLDLMATITVGTEGNPHLIYAAHLLPEITNGQNWQTLPPLRPGELDINCHELILSLEKEFSQKVRLRTVERKGDRAILVSVTTAPRRLAEDSIAELRELARSSRIEVCGTVIQHRRKVDSRFLLGPGKLSELVIMALQKGADLLIFDQELNFSQVRSITDMTELRVIDRTQLILDIFANRAQSREGKIQVELAQLRYILPRLVGKSSALSRLTGGIGGRGPGETKLEIDRRRVRDRIAHLEKELKAIRRQRSQRRHLRNKKGLPIISIIGYTNAGKSTLLNMLTNSTVLAEDRLFATLDPTSRRMRFPCEREVIITDTVGFIRNLPRDLIAAFRATLEELEDASLLIHLIDVSHPRFEDQIESVERIVEDLELNRIPLLRVLNKKDLIDAGKTERLARKWDAVAISALDQNTFGPLIKRMEELIFKIGPWTSNNP